MDININFHIPFSLLTALLVITVAVNLLLAWRSWISNRTNPINIHFALAILMAALWSASNLGTRIIVDPSLFNLFFRLAFVFATFITLFFYLFTYYFPYQTFKLTKFSWIILLSSTFFVIIISIVPNMLVPKEIMPENRTNLAATHNLLWHIIFAMYFSVTMFFSFRNMWVKFRHADGIWRLRLKQVMTAMFIAAVGGSTFNLFIPLFFNRYIVSGNLGPVFTVAMAAYIWYHIFWKTHRVPK